MSLKDIFEAITKKTAEAGKQQAEITRKLEANKGEKARAEAAKAAALEAKDEQAYKAACRAIADADAGIEFNTICLNEFQRKQLAAEAEDAKIKSGLRQGMKEIYVDAILRVEKLANEMQDITESAMNKLKEIDIKADEWDKGIMRNPRLSPFCTDKSLSLLGLYNGAKARINQLANMKKADPFFHEGGK